MTDRRAKILFLANTMNMGGVEVSLLGILNALPQDRFEMHLGLLNVDGPLQGDIPKHVAVRQLTALSDYLRLDDSPVKSIARDLKRLRWGRALRTAWAAASVVAQRTRIPYYDRFLRGRSIVDDEYDIVISYAGPSEILDWCAATYITAKRRLGWMHFDVNGGCFDRPETTRRAYSRFDRIYVVAESSRDSFDRKYPELADRTRVFHNLVDVARVKRLGSESVDTLPQGVKRIVTVGRLQHVKGQDLAIRAAAILKARGHKFVWSLVGTGVDEENFKQLARELDVTDCVRFEGMRRNPYPYMRDADVYVQTSRHEGYCITLAEAKCFEAPIVSTHFAGSEQIEGRPHSHIVEFDPKALADKVELELKQQARVSPVDACEVASELSALIDYLTDSEG